MSPAALGSRPGGTEAPFAYVFRALDLQNESTAAGAERLPAFANWMAVVWRPRSPLLSPLGALSAPRGGGAVRSIGADVVLRAVLQGRRAQYGGHQFLSPRVKLSARASQGARS